MTPAQQQAETSLSISEGMYNLAAIASSVALRHRMPNGVDEATRTLLIESFRHTAALLANIPEAQPPGLTLPETRDMFARVAEALRGWDGTLPVPADAVTLARFGLAKIGIPEPSGGWDNWDGVTSPNNWPKRAPEPGVELHDAQIEGVKSDAGQVVIQLEAFVHDDGASDSCAGAWQRIDLVFDDGRAEQRGSPGWVLDGSLRIAHGSLKNMLPASLVHHGSCVLTLTGAEFELVVHGAGVELVIAGPPHDREEGR